jgi:POT family proton-dependent oligopeptide transporter
MTDSVAIETTPLKPLEQQQQKASFRPDDELPTNVETREQLALLPPECLSGEKERPLRHVDDQGHVFFYSLKPMRYSVILILMVELLERFSFYGIFFTLTLYVTGVYDDDWNAGLTSVDAASFVSMSTAVAYSTPFVGAILADVILGDYKSIILGALGLYLPGIVLVTLTTIPYLLGDVFNSTALSIAVLFLWPMGTGIVKSIVNVMGAKQFHPLLQSSIIERYYVNFYMTINIGALSGITMIPILAQTNVTCAYMIPCVALTTGICFFISGTPKYVKSKPRGELFVAAPPPPNKDSSTIGLTTILRITILIVPFCIAYSQMPTTFIVQGTVMTKAFGFIDAATMNSLDGLSVLVFGYITGNKIYPLLASKGIKLPTTYKFAIGSMLGACAISWSLVVEYMIHRAYDKDGSQVCVLWQAPAYILIGWGEIFAVSAAYEVAFTASAPENKVLASATNIFCVGGIPNIISIFLYQTCQDWFRNSTRGNTNISHISDYATAHVYKYFLVLMGILFFGIILNTLPPVRDFVESIETKAAELVRTPRMTPTPPRKKRTAADEESPMMLEKNRYLKRFGKGPNLVKMGSMRAGPSLGHKESKKQHVKYKYIPKLYNSQSDKSNIVLPPKMTKKSGSNGSLPTYNRHDSV